MQLGALVPDGDLASIMWNESSQGPYFATLNGNLSPLGGSGARGSVSSYGFVSANPAFTAVVDAVGTETIDWYTANGASSSAIQRPSYEAPYVVYHSSYTQDGFFVVKAIADGIGGQTPGLTLYTVGNPQLTEVATGGRVLNGRARYVTHSRAGGASYVAYTDDARGEFGVEGPGDLVVARVDGTTFTELKRVPISAARVASLAGLRLVVDGERFTAVALTASGENGRDDALVVQEIETGVEATVIPLDTFRFNATLDVSGTRAAVAFSDRGVDGKASAYEVKNGALTPLGPRGFTKDPSSAWIHLYGEDTYVGVHYFGPDGLEILQRY